MAASLQGLDHL